MEAEITSPETDARVKIPSDGRVEIYRVPEQQNEVVARVVNGEIEETKLGIKDVSVSRRGTDANPNYVKLFNRDDQIFIMDTGMTENVKVEDVFDTLVLSKKEEYAVIKDSKLHLGHHTILEVIVTEAETEEEPQIDGDPIKAKVRLRIDQCKKWLRRGTNREAYREAQALSDLLKKQMPLEDGSSVTTNIYDEFLEFEDKLENQVDDKAGRDRGGEQVHEGLKNDGVRILDRLENIYA